MASAASLYQDLDPKSIYYDKRSGIFINFFIFRYF